MLRDADRDDKQSEHRRSKLMDTGIAYKALDMARESGADAARVVLAEGSSSTISLLNCETDTLRSSISSALNINLFVNGRYGTFSTNRLETSEVKAFIRDAVETTSLLAPDEFRTLPDPSICYDGKGFDLDLLDKDFNAITPEQKMAFISELASETPLSDPRLISVENEFEDEFQSEIVLDTNGLEVTDTQSFFSVSTECTVRGEDGIRPQGYWVDGSLKFSSLKKGAGAEAFGRALAMLGARKIKSGRYPVVLENVCAGSLVSTLLRALSGSSLQQRNSFLNDSLGRKVFPSTMNLCDRPHIPGMPGSTWYDAEGIATADMDIIKEGVVNTYFLGTYFARKMGLPVTVQAPSAPCFPINDGLDCRGQMRKTGRGILITGFNGGNCNGLTGDFSYGVEGFLFENGEMVHPIKEMNFSGNMLKLWNSLTLIGNDPLTYTRRQIPSLSFSEGEFSGL